MSASEKPFNFSGTCATAHRCDLAKAVTKGKCATLKASVGTEQRNRRNGICGGLKPMLGSEWLRYRACGWPFCRDLSPCMPSYAHVSRSAFAGFPLTEAMRTGEGLNVSTRRGLIGTSIPVRGLRPIRSRLDRTAKRPKDRSLTASPRTSASEISSSAISKMSRAWARDNVRQES